MRLVKKSPHFNGAAPVPASPLIDQRDVGQARQKMEEKPEIRRDEAGKNVTYLWRL